MHINLLTRRHPAGAEARAELQQHYENVELHRILNELREWTRQSKRRVKTARSRSFLQKLDRWAEEKQFEVRY